MKKRIIAFYDLLLYAIICIPLIVTAVVLLFILVTKGTSEFIYENWYLVVIFAGSFTLPIGGAMLFRYCVIKNGSIHFHYFPFTQSWEKVWNNIDIEWNQDVLISEIKDIEAVKLTEEEKKTKVYYKHLFNKYLKIGLKCGDLKYGNLKYVYVGNYSNYQIKKIIKLINNNSFN